MKIEVTQDDIDNGRRCDPDCCPIGRAISRAGVVHYGVVGAAVMVEDELHNARPLPLPAEVRSWILEFDGDRPVEPITFELQVQRARKAGGSRSNGQVREMVAAAKGSTRRPALVDK